MIMLTAENLRKITNYKCRFLLKFVQKCTSKACKCIDLKHDNDMTHSTVMNTKILKHTKTRKRETPKIIQVR